MKKSLVTLLIILGVIILAIFILKKPEQQVSENVAKCIGENSNLYVQLGCSHCKTQEDMFGEYYEYLNVTDCYYEKNSCLDISGTPTWVINNEKYLGVQSIEKLQQLTNCY